MTDADCIQEIKPSMIEPMKQKATFLQSEIQDGDIVCFQTEMSEQSIDIDRQAKHLTPPAMYDFFLNRLQVHFKPRYEEFDGKKLESFDLMLSKKMNYEQMTARVGEHLQSDPTKFRFFTPQANGSIKAAISRKLNQTLAEMSQPTYNTPINQVFIYEPLDIPLAELETKKNVKLTWMGIHNKEESQHSFLMNKTSSFNDVIDQLLKNVKLAPTNGSGRIRIFELSNGRRLKIHPPGEIIRDHSVADLYAEEIPDDELNANEPSDKIIHCFHYQKDTTRTHGVPFRFVVKTDEKFEQTKVRLQARMGMGEKEFARCKFSLVQPSTYSKASPITDEDVLREHKWVEDDALAIDHAPRRTAGLERAVYIK